MQGQQGCERQREGCGAECRGSRAGHMGYGGGHQGDEQGQGQAREAEPGSSQGQAEGAEQDLDQWAVSNPDQSNKIFMKSLNKIN